MSRTRRSYTTEYKVEAAHRVIDSGRTIASVARDLGLNESLLGSWVADERRRTEAAAAQGDTPLTPAERDELTRLRKQVVEQEKDISFLKKASAYAGDRGWAARLSRVVSSVDGCHGKLVPVTIAIVALDDGPWVIRSSPGPLRCARPSPCV